MEFCKFHFGLSNLSNLYTDLALLGFVASGCHF
jgi:hypothetical protein